MHFTLVNLLGVATVAFCVPFVLGFFPRVRVPAVALELIAGIIVGPSVLDWIEPGPVVSVMASIGVAFLLFLAGLELDLGVLKGAALARGSLSFLLAFALAFAMMTPLGAAGIILSPLLVAIALSSTSLGILVPVLRDAGRLDTAVGRFTMSGASAAEVATSGMRFELGRIRGIAEVERAVLFLAVMVVVRTVSTVLYRPFLTWRECLASGLLQSTNLSFIVVAVAVGSELGHLREMNAAALILAGLASAVVLPTVASALLSGAHGEATEEAKPIELMAEGP